MQCRACLHRSPCLRGKQTVGQKCALALTVSVSATLIACRRTTRMCGADTHMSASSSAHSFPPVLPVPNDTGLLIEWVLFTSVVHAQQELASSTMHVISGWSTQQDGSPSAYPVAESGKLAGGIDRHRSPLYSWQPSHGHFRYPVIWHPTACTKGGWVGGFQLCVMCRRSAKCMCTRAWRKPCQNHWSSECFFTDSSFVTLFFLFTVEVLSTVTNYLALRRDIS